MKNKIVLLMAMSALSVPSINAITGTAGDIWRKARAEMTDVLDKWRASGYEDMTLYNKANALLKKVEIEDPMAKVVVDFRKEMGKAQTSNIFDKILKPLTKAVGDPSSGKASGLIVDEVKTTEDDLKEKVKKETPGSLPYLGWLRRNVDYTKILEWLPFKAMGNAFSSFWTSKELAQAMKDSKEVIADLVTKTSEELLGAAQLLIKKAYTNLTGMTQPDWMVYNSLPTIIKDKFLQAGIVVGKEFEVTEALAKECRGLSEEVKALLKAVVVGVPTKKVEEIIKLVQPLSLMNDIFEDLRTSGGENGPQKVTILSGYKSEEIGDLCRGLETKYNFTLKHIEPAKDGYLVSLKNWMLSHKKVVVPVVMVAGACIAYRYSDYLPLKAQEWLDKTVGVVQRKIQQGVQATGEWLGDGTIATGLAAFSRSFTSCKNYIGSYMVLPSWPAMLTRSPKLAPGEVTTTGFASLAGLGEPQPEAGLGGQTTVEAAKAAEQRQALVKNNPIWGGQAAAVAQPVAVQPQIAAEEKEPDIFGFKNKQPEPQIQLQQQAKQPEPVVQQPHETLEDF
jgi:hypothetical protein